MFITYSFKRHHFCGIPTDKCISRELTDCPETIKDNDIKGLSDYYHKKCLPLMEKRMGDALFEYYLSLPCRPQKMKRGQK